MTSVEETLRRVAEIATAHGVRSALVGGMAISVRCEPRFTRDVDLAIAASSDADAEAVVGNFTGAGFQVEAIVEQEAADRIATVRLRRRASTEEPFVDLLFGSSGIEPEIVTDAEQLEVLPTVWVPVATAEHLLATKVLAVEVSRPQDEADARALAATLDDTGIKRVRGALALIERRGFNRGRDLFPILEELLSN